MFKGPKSGRGSLAGTGLKVRVSGGFKRPSRRGMPSNGRTWPHNLEPDGSIPHLTAPSSTYVSYKPKRPSEMWKWIFSPLLPPFSFVLRARSFCRQNFFSLPPPRRPLTHVNNASRCGPASRERSAAVRHMFRKSLCVMRRKTMCSGSLQAPWTVSLSPRSLARSLLVLLISRYRREPRNWCRILLRGSTNLLRTEFRT